MAEKTCGNCLHRCMDMDMDPYCAEVNKPWGRVLHRGVPTECGSVERKLWNMDTRPMTMNDFQKHVHETAKSKGWWEGKRTLDECVVLIHSEVSEALESYRKNEDAHFNHDGKPEGYGIELGDVLIRIFDTCESQGWSLADGLAREISGLDGPNSAWRRIQQQSLVKMPIASFVNGLLQIHGNLMLKPSLKKALVDAAIATFALAQYANVDLEAMVKIKAAYNETRPHRHGGKRL